MSQFCPECGTKNLDEAKFCKSCGFNMQEAVKLIQKDKERQKNDDNKRRAETARELDNYKKSVNSNSSNASLLDDNAKTENNDGIKGFGAFVIFAIIVILIFRACSTDYDHYEAPASEAKSETKEKSFTDTTPKVPEKVTETEGKDVVYYNKSQKLWDEKNGEYKNPKKAIEHLTKAIEINPSDPTYYNNRGVVYNQIEQYKNATKDYDKSIKLNSKDGLVYQNRGYNYWNRNLISNAKTDAKKACSLGQCQLKKDLAESEKNNQQQTSDNNAVDIERYSEGQCESMYASDTEEYKQCIKNSY
jgi:tetratricopeptide (TPR) repeat protein